MTEPAARGSIDPLLRTTSIPPRLRVQVGDVDVTEFVRTSTFGQTDRMPRVELVLEGNPLPRFDYLAPVAILREGAREPHFGGQIVESRNSGDSLHLEVASVPSLREVGVAPWVATRVGAPDMMQMHIRGAGFTPDRIQLQRSLWLPVESFEVLQPVTGLPVDRAIDLGLGVRLVPPNADVTTRFSQEVMEPLGAALHSADSFVVTYTLGHRWMSDAEAAGLDVISTALDWVTVRLRNGESVSVSSELRSFDRAQMRGFPRTQRVVLVTGMRTGRSWLRETANPPSPAQARIQEILQEPLPPAADARSALAYRSFSRAADESGDSLSRIGALWEALEYYAANSPEVQWFSKQELRALRRRSAGDLTDAQMKRLDFAIGLLNSSSLQDRIWRLASDDGVYLTQADRDVIARTRQYRNSMVHGGEVPTIEKDELNYATSVVARLLIGRARRAIAGG